jgi:hypothetical protein
LSDTRNCGSCGTACTSGEYCTKGFCGPCAALVINEFFFDPAFVQLVDYPGGTLGPMYVPSIQGLKYVELFNTCPTESIDLTGWELQAHYGTPDNPWRTLVSLSGSLPSGGYRVYGNSSFEPKDGTIGGEPTDQIAALRLTFPNKLGQQTEADFVTWIQYFLGYPAAKSLYGLAAWAWSRIPNGTNTGNNYDDFKPTDLSPKQPNVPLNNGVKSGTETDVDCGGPVIANFRCATGKACLQSSDCLDGPCIDGTCRVTSCSDGVKYGTETDIDCGGECPTKCAFGLSCQTRSDCSTNDCFHNICTRACIPNDPSESCGNYICSTVLISMQWYAKCLTGCNSDSDCVTGAYCSNPGTTCEGFDCWRTGTCLAKKGLGSSCIGSNECLSGSCVNNVCSDL